MSLFLLLLFFSRPIYHIRPSFLSPSNDISVSRNSDPGSQNSQLFCPRPPLPTDYGLDLGIIYGEKKTLRPFSSPIGVIITRDYSK